MAHKILTSVSEDLLAPVGGQEFRKGVLRVGTWIHPATKEVVHIDLTLLQDLAKETNRWIQNGNNTTFPDRHTESAKANMGYWKRFEVKGDWLYGVVVVADPEVPSKLNKTMREVSVSIIGGDGDGVIDPSGNAYTVVMDHICATEHPVIQGQPPFDKLSIFTRMNTMDVKEPNSKDNKDVKDTPGVTWSLSTANMAIPELEQLQKDYEAQKLELAALKQKQETELGAFRKLQDDIQRERIQLGCQLIDEAVQAGKIDKGVADLIKPLMGLASDTKVLSLSATGALESSPYNFQEKVKGFLAQRKKMSALLSVTPGSTNPPDPESSTGPDPAYAQKLFDKVRQEREKRKVALSGVVK